MSSCPTCGGGEPDGGTVAVSGPDENGQYDTTDCPDHRPNPGRQAAKESEVA